MVSCDDSLKFLRESLTELPVSQLKVEDLPDILRQLDLCLQKSNENVTELRDSLKFVLDREASLKDNFDVLTDEFSNYREQSEAKRKEIQHEYDRKLTELNTMLKSQVDNVTKREAARKG